MTPASVPGTAVAAETDTRERPRTSRIRVENLADWLIVAGGLGLFLSLFLTWSHQFSPAFLAQWGSSDALRGVPHDPTAWQVYSATDVLLAMLAAALIAVALAGRRSVRVGAAGACAIALAFTLHALSVPPTNAVNIFDPFLNVPNYVPNSPGAGIGETIAIVALALAIAGLVASFTTD